MSCNSIFTIKHWPCLVVGIVDFVFMASGMANELPKAVQQHQATLDRMKSIHLRLEYKESFPSEGSDSGRLKGSEQSYEIWKRGNRERYTWQVHRRAGADGKYEDVPPDYQWRDQSFGDSETRDFYSWTPESVTTPLDFVKDRKTFERVKCSISTRVPREFESGIRRGILFQVANKTTLAELAANSTLEVTEAPDGLVRIVVVSSPIEHLKGAVIDLGPKHDFLIKNMRTSNGMEVSVDSFLNVDGSFFPGVVKMSIKDIRSEVHVTEVELNKEVTDSQLSIEFPSGARVDQPDRGLIHIWGEGAPLVSFVKFEDYLSYLEGGKVPKAK